MKKGKGFTLVDLMICISIIGILIALALPIYSEYSDRAKFSEVIFAATPAKITIELCMQLNTLDDCSKMDDGNSGKINGWANSKQVLSVSIEGSSIQPEIVVTSVESLGKVTYILSAKTSISKVIKWNISPLSSCIAKDWC